MGQTEAKIWPEGAPCAVSMTYDGALAEHLEVAALLDSLGLRATFFASPTRLLENPNGWRSVGERHEIGNHSLFGVAEGGTLLNWNIPMVEADVKSTSKLIDEIIGKPCRAFALPGWSTACLDGDYLPALQRLFEFIRSDRREVNRWRHCSLQYIGSYPLDDVDPVPIIEQARECSGWAVFRAAKLGDFKAHERFLKALSCSGNAWVATFSEVAVRLAELSTRETAQP